MSERKKKTQRTDDCQCPRTTQGEPTFYGGLKSANEVYFQMASLFKVATKGNLTLSDLWIDRIMAAHGSNTSGKFF